MKRTENGGGPGRRGDGYSQFRMPSTSCLPIRAQVESAHWRPKTFADRRTCATATRTGGALSPREIHIPEMFRDDLRLTHLASTFAAR